MSNAYTVQNLSGTLVTLILTPLRQQSWMFVKITGRTITVKTLSVGGRQDGGATIFRAEMWAIQLRDKVKLIWKQPMSLMSGIST